MKACLMVMNPREIPECISAFKALQIDKVWLKRFTEKALEARISEFIETTSYDDYLICSDDTLPTQRALDSVLAVLEAEQVVTGWSNNHPGGNGANLMLKPMQGLRWALSRALFMTRFADESIMGLGFSSIDSVMRQPEIFRTYFVGFSLTGMRRDLWMDFPFRTIYSKVTKRCQSSDLSLSHRLGKAGVPMYAVKSAFVRHLKSRENWMVGKKDPEVAFEQFEYSPDYIDAA